MQTSISLYVFDDSSMYKQTDNYKLIPILRRNVSPNVGTQEETDKCKYTDHQERLLEVSETPEIRFLQALSAHHQC